MRIEVKKPLLGFVLIVVFIFSFYSWNKIENSAVISDNEMIEVLQQKNDSLKIVIKNMLSDSINTRK